MQKLTQKLRNEKGFTLIELLIVIAIMAVLMAIIVPRVTNAFSNSQVQADQANKKLLQTAVERYYLDNNTYPVTGTTLPDGSQDIDEVKLVTNKYIDEPTKDPWNLSRPYRILDGVVQLLGKP